MKLNLISIGLFLILIGMFLLIAGVLLPILKEKKVKGEGGFIIFVGPIPILGATSKTMFYLMIALSIFLIIFSLLILRGI